MYKHVSLLVGKQDGPSINGQWTERFASAVDDFDPVQRSHHVLPVDRDAAEYDGLAELYFDSPDAVENAGDHPVLGDASVGDPIALDRSPWMAGEEIVELDHTDGNTDGCYKHSAFLIRKEGMTYDAFLDHWSTEHVPLARNIPGVVRYSRVVPTDRSAVAFDGIAELYFDDISALRAGLGHESSRDYDPDHPQAKAPRDDVDNFLEIGDRPRFVGEERVILRHSTQ